MPHINKNLDYVVDAFIVHKDKVLLTFHKKTQEWLPIGGHIENEEDVINALKREIKEETGLSDVEILSAVDYSKESKTEKDWVFEFMPVPHFIDSHCLVNDSHKHFDFRYIVISKTDKVKYKRDESEKLQWFSDEELDDPKLNVLPYVKECAQKAIKITRKK